MLIKSPFNLDFIYVYRIPDEAHKGALKVGKSSLSKAVDLFKLTPNCKELNEAAKKRINGQLGTAGIKYDLLYTECTAYFDGTSICSFNDKQVHQVLINSGIKRKCFDTEHRADEWFKTDLETVKNGIAAVKDGRSALNLFEITTEKTPVDFRPEQREAIEKTKKWFKKGNMRMLWYAKMRFGKTLSALQVIKDLQYHRTIILTHRPVVNAGWFDDFGKIFYDQPNFNYGSKTKGHDFDWLEQAAKNDEKAHYVYFASMQDLRGSVVAGGKFDKNDELFNTNWDLVILDEAHEGTQTILGQNVLTSLGAGEKCKFLNLSGTPFNISNKFKQDETYTWDYVMEQRAKAEWELTHPGDYNPYSCLPRLNIFTYDLGKLVGRYEDEDKAFNFREFFRVWTGKRSKDGREVKDEEVGEFVHKKDVRNFLDILCRKDEESNYPYANEEFRNNFRHTLWMVPGVKEALALERMIENHPVLGNFEVVNVAGEGDPEDDAANNEALEKLQKAIGRNPDTTRTICLSCGRLTTGVSVPEWTAVLMLSGSSSTAAQGYMQTIFRVQTPAIINGREKKECYVFDFAPDRTLTMIAEAANLSARAGGATESDRETMRQFLNFCPIISFDGSRTKEYDVSQMLTQLKRAYIERVVNNGFEDNHLYNRNLLDLSDVEIKDFNELKGIIGQTKAIATGKGIVINDLGFDDEDTGRTDTITKNTKEKKKKDKEVEAKKKKRQEAISILKGISIRMPLLIYGAELKDENEEISIDNFASLIDKNSWEEFMPHGVTKEIFNRFRKYYDPEIFIASAKRIRQQAKAADELGVTERIIRIAEIFSTFRNPDKETVLTPWRVVNMHMNECFGGYDFFDEQHNDTLDEPRFADRGQVTYQVFADPNTRILELNSKSGLYPLYMAYSVYRAKLEDHIMWQDTMTQEEMRNLWDKVIDENIFVVCKTPMAVSITKRTLVGYRDKPVNAKYFNDLIELIKVTPNQFCSIVSKGFTFWHSNDDNNMKFNAIVGNPPYQVMDGGAKASAMPVYQHFVNIAKMIKPQYISMIMPAKWFNGGRGLDDFRNDMLSDQRISNLFDYVDGHECFPGVDIAGGVCYFLWDEKHNGRCRVTTQFNSRRVENIRILNSGDVFIRHVEELSILDKIGKEKKHLSDIIHSQKPFGLRTYVRPMESGDIQLRYTGGQGPYRRDLITQNESLIDKWKVITSYTTAEHAGETDKNGQKRIISTLEVLEPGVICTETYLLVATFDTKEEAENLLSYIKTRFVRSLIAMITTTQHLARANFRFVPLQDFNKPWTDSELYLKYGLTLDEIAFIESMIKPME